MKVVWFLLLVTLLDLLVLALVWLFEWRFTSLVLWWLLLLVFLLWWFGGLFTCLVTLVIAMLFLLATFELLLATKLVYSCIVAIITIDNTGLQKKFCKLSMFFQLN